MGLLDKKRKYVVTIEWKSGDSAEFYLVNATSQESVELDDLLEEMQDENELFLWDKIELDELTSNEMDADKFKKDVLHDDGEEGDEDEEE